MSTNHEQWVAYANEHRIPLKAAYDAAVKDNKKQFTYDGEPVLVAYAKYLIEYLDEIATDNKQ